MQYLTALVWNTLEKNYDTDIMADENDIVFESNGIAFLIQTKEGFNNIVAQRLHFRPGTFKEAVKDVRKVCIENGIQFIRVEGNARRYKFLVKMLAELFGTEVDIVKDLSNKDRNIYYVKVY